MHLFGYAAVVPVIITAGQSNTDGRVPSADMPAYLKAYAVTGMSNVLWSDGNSGYIKADDLSGCILQHRINTGLTQH